jgi:hypothetical protein
LILNSEKTKAKYFCAEVWTGMMGLKVLAKIVFSRRQMRLWDQDADDGVPGKSRGLPADLPVGLALGLMDMGDDVASGSRVVCGRTEAQQERTERSILRELACTSLLLSCVFGTVMAGQAAAADNGARIARHVVDNEKGQSERDLAPPPQTQRVPETTMRQPQAPTTGLNVSAPSPEASTPALEAAEPKSDAQKSSLKAEGPAAKDRSVPQLVLSADMARKIGQKIWLNEAGGNRDAITSWNANEEFASLGIGHFIWFPLGKWLPFEESFPAMLEFMRKGHRRLPAWLDQAQIPANPWTSRAEFKKNFNSPEMRELRQFLLDTVAEQTQFLVARAQGAMEKILKNTPDAAEREHIVTQFSRVVRASDDLYPLIDYINFKGEGTNPNETAVDRATGQRQGWGLKQVLLKMNGTASDPKAVRAEFADAVRLVLQQRVRNIPANRVFEIGWLRRADTYRRPIGELEPSPRRLRRESSRAIAAQ